MTRKREAAPEKIYKNINKKLLKLRKRKDRAKNTNNTLESYEPKKDVQKIFLIAEIILNTKDITKNAVTTPSTPSHTHHDA